MMVQLGKQRTYPSLPPCKVSRMEPRIAARVSPESRSPGKLVMTRHI